MSLSALQKAAARNSGRISADWMPRNLDRRVEAVAPVEDGKLRRQLEALMQLYLEDTTAWVMHSDGQFTQRQPEGEQNSAQAVLMDRWRGGLSAQVPPSPPSG
jgi:polyphosphate kinase